MASKHKYNNQYTLAAAASSQPHGLTQRFFLLPRNCHVYPHLDETPAKTIPSQEMHDCTWQCTNLFAFDFLADAGTDEEKWVGDWTSKPLYSKKNTIDIWYRV